LVLLSGRGETTGAAGAEDTTGGAYTGAGFVNLTGAPENFIDGTRDATHNYAISTAGKIYSFDLNWQNPALLFTIPPLGASDVWTGIAYDATNNSLWIPLTATPASLGFGSQGLGSPTTARTIKVNSNINTVITFSSIVIGGANPGDFIQSATTCGTGLAAQANCTISIQFAPIATGARAATLTISSDASNGPQTVALSGTGVQPLTATPASLGFGSQGLGSPTAPRTVTVANNLSAAVTFSGITIGGANPGDFIQSATTCGPTLAAQANCTISIQFAPVATGARTATLTISSNAANSPQTVTLTGTGR
jgi:hypothetical protein